jgi:hypothetical protein
MSEDKPEPTLHYRALANEAFAAADRIKDRNEALLMRQIGFAYRHLADRAEQRQQQAEEAEASQRSTLGNPETA